MLASTSSQKGPATMVTLVTERLQQQSLTDSPCRTYSISLCSAERRSQSGSQLFHSIHGENDWSTTSQTFPPRVETVVRTAPLPVRGDHTAMLSSRSCDRVAVTGATAGHSWSSIMNPNSTCRPSLALPNKRHCRSLSESDKLMHCRSPWKPGNGSGVWTAVCRRSDSSSSSPEVTSLALPPGGHQSPAPRPLSAASSGFVDGSERSDACSLSNSSAHWASDSSPCRCFSVSQELLATVALPPPRPRCHSQPSELWEHRNRLKRRRGECRPWTRPALDFLKMTRTLKSSRSLCSLDYEDTEEPEMETGTSPSNHDIVTDAVRHGVGLAVLPADVPQEHSYPSQLGNTAAVSESDEDASDHEYTEAGTFPLDCGDLDLEEIENN